MHQIKLLSLLLLLLGLQATVVCSQEDLGEDRPVTVDPEILRGSVTPERAWWDVQKYHLAIEVFPETKSLRGSNLIEFSVLKSGQKMQVDLQPPLVITRVLHGTEQLRFERDGNVYWIEFSAPLAAGVRDQIKVDYEGKPVESRNPPWSGGFSWQKDDQGNHFIATSCQGIGASVWWPNKDHGYDEPDEGMSIDITVPAELTAVSNGRLVKTDDDLQAKTRTYYWRVTQPINNYGVNVNIGKYVNFSETYSGEFGKLDLDYWVLDYQREQAEAHFKEVPRTLAAFEYWFGKYPFYEDSYKLVVVPYLGMEHQSSVTYGNGFKNGYRGTDLSATGVGLKFDFIIVHESGHEWFGNNISMRDVADMWIHESFTNYAENLFVEYHFSEQEAQDYVIGCRKRIQNDRPIIGTYNRNQEGSGDMYYKGGNMLHTMRHIIADDTRWRGMLRGLNETFWHQTVTTEQVERYLSERSGIDFAPFFEQYLRTTDIPVFKYTVQGKRLSYSFDNIVDGFSFPILVSINGTETRLKPTRKTQELNWPSDIETVVLDRNFYIDVSGH